MEGPLFEEKEGFALTRVSICGKMYVIAIRNYWKEGAPMPPMYEVQLSPEGYPDTCYQMLPDDKGAYSFVAGMLGMIPDQVKNQSKDFAAVASELVGLYLRWKSGEALTVSDDKQPPYYLITPSGECVTAVSEWQASIIPEAKPLGHTPKANELEAEDFKQIGAANVGKEALRFYFFEEDADIVRAISRTMQDADIYLMVEDVNNGACWGRLYLPSFREDMEDVCSVIINGDLYPAG